MHFCHVGLLCRKLWHLQNDVNTYYIRFTGIGLLDVCPLMWSHMRRCFSTRSCSMFSLGSLDLPSESGTQQDSHITLWNSSYCYERQWISQSNTIIGISTIHVKLLTNIVKSFKPLYKELPNQRGILSSFWPQLWKALETWKRLALNSRRCILL